MRELIDSFEPDVSTAAGRKEVAGFAYKIARTKMAIDGVGKDLTAKAKEEIRKVDAARKTARDTLDKWKDEVRAPLTAYEQERKEADEALLRMGNVADNPGETIEEIEATLDRLNNCDPANFPDDYCERAEKSKQSAVEKVKAKLATAHYAEKERQELEQLRREKEERETAEREKQREAAIVERVKREQEEAHKRELAEAERQKQEAIEAEKRAKIEAEQAAQRERERIEAEREAERKNAEKRANDKKLRDRAIKDIADSIEVVCGINHNDARSVADAIADGRIKHVSATW